MNRDFTFYMANIGVEIERLFKFKEQNDTKNMYGSWQRFIDLVAYMQKDKSIPSYRKKEILRIKEYLGECIFESKKCILDLDFIKKYFTLFYIKFVNSKYCQHKN